MMNRGRFIKDFKRADKLISVIFYLAAAGAIIVGSAVLIGIVLGLHWLWMVTR